MSTAFLFPGQGSQFSGMGSDLFPQYPELVSASDEILGYSIVELCESEDSSRLNSTNFTQPALYVVSCLQAKALLDEGKNPSFCAGHSVGEFAALQSANSISFNFSSILLRSFRPRNIVCNFSTAFSFAFLSRRASM